MLTILAKLSEKSLTVSIRASSDHYFIAVRSDCKRMWKRVFYADNVEEEILKLIAKF